MTTSQQIPRQDYSTSSGAGQQLYDHVEAARPLAVGKAFLSALARRNFEALEACFAREAHFRALVPSGMREGSGPQEAVAWLRRWFETANPFVMQHSELDLVADRLRISYQISCREEGVWYLIEQQAYCAVENNQLSAMYLLCSGFRPV